MDYPEQKATPEELGLTAHPDSDEIASCPFCGEASELSFCRRDAAHFIRCKTCDGRGPDAHTEDGALAQWNRRTYYRADQ